MIKFSNLDVRISLTRARICQRLQKQLKIVFENLISLWLWNLKLFFSFRISTMRTVPEPEILTILPDLTLNFVTLLGQPL